MKMTVSSEYIKQAQLLMDVLPDVSSESSFALKGGTAINMFYQDMPRISVDIDLTWLPVADRSASLQDIDDALNRIVDLINATTTHSEVSAGVYSEQEPATHKSVLKEMKHGSR